MLFDPEENSDYFKAVSPGCMNPNAINYNPDAKINDGSCQQLTISVISPNGDEEWQLGSTYTITWNSSGLSRYQGLNPLTSDYIVKVGDYDPSNNKKVKSKNLFSESVKTNKLLQNENINLDRVKITENARNNIIPLSSNFPSSYVNIKLYRSSDSSGSYTFYQTISSSTSNDGSYNWAISSSLSESYYYKIRIEDYYDSSDYDESDSYFTLSSQSITVLENFESISDWTNTTSSNNDDAWIISSGYSGNGAKSTCSGYGYGDIISKSFYFSTEGKLTFWFKRLYVSDYNNLYLLVDGDDVWNATAYEWTQAEVDVLSGSHTISFETRFSGTILLDQLEFTPN